jgi:hypothetical protein
MKAFRLLLGTQRSKKHFMLEAANILLLAHSCNAVAGHCAQTCGVGNPRTPNQSSWQVLVNALHTKKEHTSSAPITQIQERSPQSAAHSVEISCRLHCWETLCTAAEASSLTSTKAMTGLSQAGTSAASSENPMAAACWPTM